MLLSYLPGWVYRVLPPSYPDLHILHFLTLLTVLSKRCLSDSTLIKTATRRCQRHRPMAGLPAHAGDINPQRSVKVY